MRAWSIQGWVVRAVLLVMLSVALVVVVRGPLDGTGHDLSAWYAGGMLVRKGVSPYDRPAKLAAQREILPGFEYLHPPFYPPWTYQAAAGLVPLGFDRALVVWAFLSALALLTAGSLLGGYQGVLFAVLFMPAVLAVYSGHVTTILLLVAVAAARALDARRDIAGGVLLAVLCSKPQLGGVVAGVLLGWAALRGRYGPTAYFAATLVALGGIGLLADPRWPLGWIDALRSISFNSVVPAKVNVTWTGVLVSLGMDSTGLIALQVAGAFAVLAIVAAAVTDRQVGAGDAAAWAVLAFFVLSPYAQFYDYTLLLIVLAACRPHGVRAILGAALLAFPYIQSSALAPVRQVTLAWMPAILALALVCSWRWPGKPLPGPMHGRGRPTRGPERVG